MKPSIGIILARFQPVHNGHLELIKKAYEENDFVYVFIGSSDKQNERNPIPYQIRCNLLTVALQELHITERINIFPLPDLYGEQNDAYSWGFYLYANIVNIIGQGSFNLYYGDGSSKIVTWFPDYILGKYVKMKYVDRSFFSVSSTMVRQKIEEMDSLEGLVPQIVIDKSDLIKTYIELYEM